MPYNSIIDRTGSQALMPEDVVHEIIQGASETSAIFKQGKRLPNMPRKVRRMPVLDNLPFAYFVTGDTGMKQTTQIQWSNKYIEAEELAVIVPIPEAVLDDVDYDIWSEIKPKLVEAFGRVIDEAILYGTGKPASWPGGILPDATTAGQVITLSTFTGDLYDAILGENGVFSKVEEDGFAVSGNIASLTMKSKFRGLRSADGVPVFTGRAQDSTTYELDGTMVDFPRNGAFDPTQSLLISGDFQQLVYAFRQDLTYKVLTEGVITDNSNNILFNLPQQDMVALRAVMRLGWQIPNPINAVNTDAATRYPFAVLKP